MESLDEGELSEQKQNDLESSAVISLKTMLLVPYDLIIPKALLLVPYDLLIP
jgi:hypothetical protein